MRRFASLFGRRGVLAATVAALIVLGVQIVLQLLNAMLWSGLIVAQGQGNASNVFLANVWNLALGSLPFVIGVFLSLWLLAPVAAELHIGHVITRSLLAVLMGAVVIFLVQFSTGLLGQVSDSQGLVFGWASAVFGSVVSSFGSALSNAVLSALGTAISMIPLTVLAGVLLWVWLREHPVKHPVAGLIDEV